jgi:hypothetical protein
MPGDAVLHLDGPRLAPLVAVVAAGLRMTGDSSTVEALDAVARMGRHLPVYRLAYTTTADGFTAEERGAPFLVPGLGFLAGTLLWEADPAAETAAGMGIVRLQRMLPPAPARQALERLAGAHAAAPGALWPDLLASTGVDPADLARHLGLSSLTARRIASADLEVHRLDDLWDIMRCTGGSDGDPVPGWEIPLGPEASLYLLDGIRIPGRRFGVWIGVPSDRSQEF